MTVSPEPETDLEDLEPYQVYSRTEILGLLRTIEQKRLLVTLYFNDGDNFVTGLLHVNPEFEELIFDRPRDASMYERLLASSDITAVAFIDKVKVQFSSPHAEATMFENGEAVRMRMPDAVLRLQRREYYRVPTPRATPLTCTAEVVGRPGKLQFTVVELSAGGFGALVNPDEFLAELGTPLKNVRIGLPNVGLLEGAAEVRRMSVAKDGGATRHRLGCEFVRLSTAMNTMLQRYINELQRAQLARK